MKIHRGVIFGFAFALGLNVGLAIGRHYQMDAARHAFAAWNALVQCRAASESAPTR